MRPISIVGDDILLTKLISASDKIADVLHFDVMGAALRFIEEMLGRCGNIFLKFSRVGSSSPGVYHCEVVLSPPKGRVSMVNSFAFASGGRSVL